MTESSIKLLTERLANTRGTAQGSRGAERVPLSLPQQAALRAGANARLLHAEWVVTPAPDPARLERAAHQLLRRHEILRTIYPTDRRMPYQRVLEVPETALTEPGDIDPTQQAPIRIALTGDVVSVTVHPVAADNQALAQIVDELGRAYTTPDDTPVAQYRDFSAAQLRDDSGLAYWTEHLAGLPDQIVPAAPGPVAAAHVRLDADQPDPALLALLAAAIHTEWGATDIAIGVLDATRPPGAEQVVGHFANRLVCRVRITPDQTPADLVGQIAQAAAEAHAHRTTRFERLRVPVQIVYTTVTALRLTLNGHEVHLREHRPDAPAADLAMTVRPEGDLEITGSVNVDAFAARLTTLAADPSKTLLPGTMHTTADTALVGLGGPPRTPTEHAVAQAIRVILELDDTDEVGREDTFFALGGDSLAALRLVARLQAEGRTVEIQTVFLYPTLRELAHEIDHPETTDAPATDTAPVAPMSASGLDPAALEALRRDLGA